MSKSRLYIGQKVEIRTQPEGEIYASMIQELEEDALAITLPVRQGQYLLLHRGESVTVEFSSDDAIYTFNTVVVDRKKNGMVSLLLLARPSTYKRRQRRQLFRLPLVLPCSFQRQTTAGKPANGGQKKVFTGQMKDLSGCGLRFSTTYPVKKNDFLTVNFTLPGETEQHFTMRGTVRWCQEGEDRAITAGLEFTEVNPAQEEQIIDYIFAQQRRRLRLSRGEKR